MNEFNVDIGDIVQISPEKGVFAGCFLVVTEVKSWGVQGYVQALGEWDEATEQQVPGGLAYYRVKYEDIEPTGGKAIWIPSFEAKEMENDDV